MFNRPSFLISVIMLGLMIWGAYLAMGAALYDLDVRKGLVVYGFSVAFILFWGFLLAMRARKLRREQEKLPPHEQSKQN